jgi:hypothetical protein
MPSRTTTGTPRIQPKKYLPITLSEKRFDNYGSQVARPTGQGYFPLLCRRGDRALLLAFEEHSAMAMFGRSIHAATA